MIDLKTCLKNARRPDLASGGMGSFRGSRSEMVILLIVTVVERAMQAIRERILNWVFPKNQRYFGRST